MVAIRTSGGILPMRMVYADLPENPFQGVSFIHESTGLPIFHDGTAWACDLPGVRLYAQPGGLTARKLVTLVAGVPTLTDPTTHNRCDGMVRAAGIARTGGAGELVAITADGEVSGFAGLNPGDSLFAGEDGDVTTDPDDAWYIIPIGWALTAARVLVRVPPAGTVMDPPG